MSLRGEAKPRRGNLMKHYKIPEIATLPTVARNDVLWSHVTIPAFARMT